MSHSRETIIEKNITLSFEFEQYLLEHPAMLEEIPTGAEIILLPKDDPELYQANLDTARRAREQDRMACLVFVEIDALAPPRSRLINPHLRTQPSPETLVLAR
ncbi:MAG: hypothetical protein HY784_16500 [Chloroflexi bacterium]|nr:hypothetical protein [Chloroflexota bacterium]